MEGKGTFLNERNVGCDMKGMLWKFFSVILGMQCDINTAVRIAEVFTITFS
jgi:hypothetical protein